MWCWRRLLRVPWTAKRSNQSILNEIIPEYSLEGLMLTAILWPPDMKNWLVGKNPDVGKEWRQEEKGMTEDEVVGWHHQLKRHEFEQAPGDSKGQGSGHAAVHGLQRVRHNWVTELNWSFPYHVFLCPLSQINWTGKYGLISGLSILFPWFLCLFLWYTILSWLLQLCSIVWSQGVWCFQLFSFPRLLWLFGFICDSIQYLGLSVIVLW